MRAYRHGSSGGSSGGSSSYGSSGGSSGGSYGGSSGGSYGGYAAPAYSTGYSSEMPIESYRVIGETPSMPGGEIIGTPVPAATDSTRVETVPADGGLLVVEVPAAAEIFVNGVATSSQGATRRFLSRGLVAGKQYEFVVRMAVDRDGIPAEETKVVSLTAGGRSTVSFAAAPASAARTSLTLRVPAEAQVWLAGSATKSTGAVRQFETSNLKPGQTWRNYEVRVAMVVDGQERTVSRTIDLAAGQAVDLTLDPTARTAAAESTASLR